MARLKKSTNRPADCKIEIVLKQIMTEKDIVDGSVANNNNQYVASENAGDVYAKELAKLKKSSQSASEQDSKKEEASASPAYAAELSRLRKTEQTNEAKAGVNAENIYAAEMAKLKKVNT